MTDLAETFADRLTEAVAAALGVEVGDLDVVLWSDAGRPNAEAAKAREAFAVLALGCFPCESGESDAAARRRSSRTLRRLCIGEATPRPLWAQLEQLEAGLGIAAADLFRRCER